MGAYQTAIAFLQTEHVVAVSTLFKEFNLLSDILKAGKNLDKLHAVFPRQPVGHVGCNNRLDQRAVPRQRMICAPFPQNVFRDQHARHIAGKAHILSVRFIFGVNAQAVSIRVRCQHNIRIYLSGQFERQRERLWILWIRIGYCREIPIG